MNARLTEWKSLADRLWSEAPFDYAEATRLSADVARQAAEAPLQQAAAQALPSLRAACGRKPEQRTKDLAQRRFSAMRDWLHSLTGPRFGKRASAADAPDRDTYYRRLLGLPTGRRLFGVEIHQAYKQAAKKAHPDGGGDVLRFEELIAARDALMKGS